MISDETYMNNFDLLLNKKYIYYPYRDNIKIIDFFVNGIFQKIYWLNEQLDVTEKFIWKFRKNISEEMFRLIFVNNIFVCNTLIRNQDYLISNHVMQVLNDLIYKKEKEKILSLLNANDIKWIQISEKLFGLLIGVVSLDELYEAGITYIELITDNLLSNQHYESDLNWKILINRVGFMPLVGFFMCNGVINNEVMEINQNENYVVVSSKINRVISVKDYNIKKNANKYKPDSSNQLIYFENRIHKSIEYINETMGKIIISERIDYDANTEIYNLKVFIYETHLQL